MTMVLGVEGNGAGAGAGVSEKKVVIAEGGGIIRCGGTKEMPCSTVAAAG